jgi:hypothetical protein
MISMFGEPKWEFKPRKKVPKHWYYITDDYCPICGRVETYKERRYDERPKEFWERHEHNEVYDYCDAL